MAFVNSRNVKARWLIVDLPEVRYVTRGWTMRSLCHGSVRTTWDSVGSLACMVELEAGAGGWGGGGVGGWTCNVDGVMATCIRTKRGGGEREATGDKVGSRHLPDTCFARKHCTARNQWF